MKKTYLYLFFLSASVFTSVSMMGQSLLEGITNLHADRFNSAENFFQKAISANPNNLDAIYWLGQTYLDEDKNDDARALYDKTLAANGNAPIILVGRGHVDLLDGKTADARQRFETALSMTHSRKGDDPEILFAIGRANVDAKKGDLAYAIEKLEAAVQRDPKYAEAYLELGNAYRKARPGEGGGQAYTNYKKAVDVDPKFVYPYIRIAKLFETQKNWDLVLQNLNEAVSKDPNFSLAYYELFYYYFFRQDYAKADEYFAKYVGSRPNENHMEHDYLNSQLCWAKKDYTCAVTKAESVKAAMGAKVKPRVLRLRAYAYLGKGDFANAKKYVDEFFAREKDEFVPPDYQLKAEAYAGAGVACADLVPIFLDGAKADTALQSRIDYLNNSADYFKSKNCKNQEAELRLVVFNSRPGSSPTNLFNAGLLFMQGDDLKRADSVFAAYTKLAPDSIYGYYWRGRVNYSLDTSMTQEPYISAMVQGYSKALAIAYSDKERYKSMGTNSALVLAGYFNNVKSNRDSAYAYVLKGLDIDSSNAQLNGIRDIFEKQSNKSPGKASGGKPTSQIMKPSDKTSLVRQ